MKNCFVVMSVMIACAPDAGLPPAPSGSAGDAETAERHRPPVLSSTPAWTVEGETADSGRCFGAAVAVGDLDGDGYRDAIVGEVPCPDAEVTQGRVAIYRGGPRLPSTTPVFTELDWQNPPLGGTGMTLAVGDVDGDHHDDLLVRSTAGVQLFAGITDLGAPLGAPLFRVPGTGGFGRAVLADVNGDGLADIISVNVRLRIATVWLSTPGAPGGPFTASRIVTPATDVLAVGDTNGDGMDDLVFTNRLDSQLRLGCRAEEPDCVGGLRSTPAWTTTQQPVSGMVPDINGDGRSEALVTDAGILGSVGEGRVWLYLSDPTTGGLAAAPAWATLGDPHYPGFGPGVIIPGDLDGDHRSTEFVMPSAGRIYAFFPQRHKLADMQPGFAWPREDATQDQIDAGEVLFRNGVAVAAAGDVNGDHFDDLIIGSSPAFDHTQPGRAYLMTGGRRHGHGDPPFLPGAPVCDLPSTGKPDLTVDQPALERSLFVENVTFAPDACEIAEGCVGGPGVRRLLRFATSVANFGGAPAIIPDSDTAPELYHFNECEGVFELDNFSQYELIDRHGSRIAAARKQSVFLVDIAPNCINAGPATLALPGQRLSPGWGDVYVADTPCNWLDATDVPDGRYTLRVSIDTQHIVDQEPVLPDTASVEIKLAGNTVTVLR